MFIGYGIDAPEQNWNDYKGDSSRWKDKILLIMVNDPPATAKEPNLFGGDALTYYGRWTYKYEEAARKGAKGVILIHTEQIGGVTAGMSSKLRSAGRKDSTLRGKKATKRRFYR